MGSARSASPGALTSTHTPKIKNNALVVKTLPKLYMKTVDRSPCFASNATLGKHHRRAENQNTAQRKRIILFC